MTGSSLHVIAQAAGERSISGVSVVLDGTRVLDSPAASIDVRLPAAVGSHTLTVEASDNLGNAVGKRVRFIVAAAPARPRG